MKKISTSSILAVAAACCLGTAVAQERHEGHKHHHHFPKDVDAFHSVLAPLWHARPSMEGSSNACAKAGEMERLANGIRSGNAAPLVASIAALKEKCQSNPAEIDTALFDVHEAFHGLADPRGEH